MLKEKHLKSTLFIVLLIMTSSLVNIGLAADENSEIIELSDGQGINITISKQREVRYFKYVYLDEENKRPDFSITANPLDSKSDPDIYVSSKDERPSERQNEFSDYSYGFDLVVVPYSHISSRNKTYFIAVQCQSKSCAFELKAVKTDYVSLTSNQVATLTFQEQATEIIRYQIPKDQTITRIILVATPINTYNLSRGIHFYINKGDKPPSSSQFDVQATTAWYDGKAAVILKDEKKVFCIGCNYTLTVEAEKGAMVKIEALVYGEIIQLSLGEGRFDAVSSEKSVAYVLDTSQIENFSEQTLTIKVTPYSGGVTLHVHPDIQPGKLTEYKWHSESFGRDTLVLKPEDLRGKGIKQLYITVEGYLTSTYRILVSGLASFSTRLQLGVPESGYVHSGQVINFLFIPTIREATDITLTLSSSEGNPDLYFKSCPSKVGCEITSVEIEDYINGKTKQSTTYPMFLVSDRATGEDTLTFNHDFKTCPRSSFSGVTTLIIPPCVYSVALINAGDTTPAHYNLLATSPQSHVRLEQNIAYRGRVDMDETDYYFLMIFEEAGIESVHFQVTTISGIVNVYASTKVLYPNITNYEQASYVNDEIVFRMSEQKEKAFTHMFYIGVHGHTQASYTILATLNYSVKAETEMVFDIIDLYEGIPQKSVMKPNHIKFFRFNLNLEKKAKEGKDIGLRLNLQPLQGQFIFYVNNNGSLPTNTSFQFTSFENNLIIDNTTQGFKGKGEYFLTVYPATSFGNENQSLSFLLSYVTADNFIWLRSGDPYYTFIDNKTRLFFKFEIEASVEEIGITKSMDDKQVDLFVSTNRDNILPSKENFNFSTTRSGSDYILITREEIRKACAKNNQFGSEEYDEAHRCYFYIGATTNAASMLYFNLFLQFNKTMIKLRSGLSLELPVPANATTPISLYYIPDTPEEVEFVATSPFRKLAIFAEILNLDDYKDATSWKFPTQTEFKFNSVSDLSTHKTCTVTIPGDRLKSCTVNGNVRCVITLSLYRIQKNSLFDFNEGATSNDTMPSWITESFNIIATNGVIPLPLGKPFVASVEENKYKYFSFRVTEPSCTILISVTPLSNGDPDIFVSKDGDGRPTMELYNYDFSSMGIAGEQLEISSDDLASKNMEGVWAVGVHGYKACTFQITVTYENNKIIQLYSSLPHDILLRAGQTIYFQYFNWNDNFEINLMNEFGEGIIRANTFNKSQEILDRLPTADKSVMFTSFKENNRERLTITNKTKNFCTGCYYLIGINAEGWNDFKGTMLITGPGETIYLQNGRSIFYSVNERELQNFAYQDDEGSMKATYIFSVVVYNGHPVIYVDHFPTPDRNQYGWKLDCDSSTVNKYGGVSTFSLLIDDHQYWQILEKEKKTTVQKNGTTYSASPNNFYITVEGQESSNFSIIALKSDSNITLKDGVPEPAYTLPSRQSVFIYNSANDPTLPNQRLKVLLSVYELDLKATTQNPDSTTSFIPQVSVGSTNMKKGVDEEVQAESIFRLSVSEGRLTESLRGQIAFSMNQHKGQYNIYVRNPYNFTLNYTITIQDRHFIKLPLNSIQMSRIDLGYSEVYEVYIEKKGKLLIDVYSCFGGVKVEAARSLNEAQRGDFKESTIKASPNHQVRELLVDPGTIYIRVQGTDGLIDDNNDPVREALYKLRVTSFATDEQVPIENFYANNDGYVVATQTANNKLKLKWDHVGFDSTKIFSILEKYQVSIKYKLVFGDDQIFTESKAICGVEPQEAGQFTGRVKLREFSLPLIQLENNSVNQLSSLEKEIELTSEEIRGSVYTSIVATVQGFTDKGLVWEIPINYKTTEIKIEKTRNSTGVSFFVLAAIIGSGVLIAAVWWYKKRFSTIESSLHYELQDTGRSQGSGSEGPQRRKNKYTGMFNQEVDTV